MRPWCLPLRVVSLLVLALGLCHIRAADSHVVPPDQVLKLLQEGNARFVAGKPSKAQNGAARRETIAQGQKPIAVIYSCSDSRVAPELVFDQGLGDLFVIRNAGHVIDDACLGSAEYSVKHLGTTLILVLGHERCGAVTAAVQGGKVPAHGPAIIKPIKPAVAKSKSLPGDPVDNAIRAHIRAVVSQLKKTKPLLSNRTASGAIKIVGARYDLDTGVVEILD